MTESVSTQLIECDHEGDPIDMLREKVKAAWKECCVGETARWKLADYLAEVTQKDLWLTWGFTSRKAYILAELPEASHLLSNLDHYCSVGRWHLSLSAPEQEQWTHVQVSKAIEALSLLKEPESRGKILELIQSGATNSKLRAVVSEAQPDQHRETQWRTINLRVSRPVYELWEKATYMARFYAMRKEPTSDDIVSCVASALLNEELEVSNDAVAEIFAGKMRCRECGSWDMRQSDLHHTVLRSAGGHDSELVRLCRECHDKVHAHIGGSPAEYAEKWEQEKPSPE